MYATLEEVYPSSMFKIDEQPPPSRKEKRRVRSVREEFTGGKESLSTAPKDTYVGRLNDYTFGCKQYGVCPKTLKEGFESGGSTPSRGPPLTKKTTKCAPLQVPNYEYPLSDADKRRYQAAVDASLNEDFEHEPIDLKPSRTVDMRTVGGYGDDDLDQYLSLDDLKDQIAIPPVAPTPNVRPATPYDPRSSPFAELLKEAANRRKERTPMDSLYAQPQEEIVVSARPPMWMDLLLFVLMGILIILIMDQLFRLAMATGMRQALEVLRPFIEEIAEARKAAAEMARKA